MQGCDVILIVLNLKIEIGTPLLPRREGLALN